MWVPSFSLRRRHVLTDFLIALSVILLVVTTIIDRAKDAMARAEDSQIVATVNNLRAALMQQALHRLIGGDMDGIAALANGNPMLLTGDRPPGNYQGEFNSLSATAVPPGSWYFDYQRRRLVYRIAYKFARDRRGVTDYALKVRLRFQDRNGNNRYDPAVDLFTNIGLVPDALADADIGEAFLNQEMR